jgi:proton-translocating NADH-quinone oxidoreductase chain N
MPTLFILIPFLGIIILNLLYPTKLRRFTFEIGCFFTMIQMFLAIAIIFELLHKELSIIAVDYFVSFSIDIYAAIVLFTIGLISLISLIIRKYSSSKDIFNFTNLILIIIIGMNGTVMVTDIFSLYVFLEVTAAVSFILIAKTKELPALDGSFKYFLMSGIATILILTGIGMLYMTTGSLEYNHIGSWIKGLQIVPMQLIIAYVFLIGGLSIKAGLVPFHMWVPEAYSSSSSSVSVLLAGIVTKAGGIYAIMRLIKEVFIGVNQVQEVFAFIAIITIVVGALLALGQIDFKRMLAYSSISQVGYIIIGAACGSPMGFLGAFLHFFNHATFKSLLFVNAGAVEMQTGTRNLNKLQGLAAKMRITGGTSVIGFLSTSGIPPLSGFWSKVLIIVALWQVGFHTYAIIALLSSILTLAYFLILQRKVFFGKTPEEFEGITEANFGFKCASLILAIITVAVGIGFPFILSFLKLKGLI